MILGLGVDAFEVSRMEQALHEGDADFCRGLFTPDEIAYCQRQRHPAEHYAARFALKEAVFKALALPDTSGASWREVELRVSPSGLRSVVLHGAVHDLAARKGVARVLASVSHSHGIAIAGAILESSHA
jgi:holo-[acyl-carrier protein] synthase